MTVLVEKFWGRGSWEGSWFWSVYMSSFNFNLQCIFYFGFYNAHFLPRKNKDIVIIIIIIISVVSFELINAKCKITLLFWKQPLRRVPWPTIMFIIFWDFLMVEQISSHHRWNEARLLVKNWYVWSASQVTKRLKT